jgi:hypothetical protein
MACMFLFVVGMLRSEHNFSYASFLFFQIFVLRGNMCQKAKTVRDVLNSESFSRAAGIDSDAVNKNHLDSAVKFGCFIHYAALSAIVLMFFGGVISLIVYRKKLKSKT